MMLPAAAQTKKISNTQVGISASFKEVQQHPQGYTKIIDYDAGEVKRKQMN